MLEIGKFVRRPFEIDAVQVTEENIEQVARWCGGEVRTNREKKRYIKVRVVRPYNSRQSEAYADDWVLYAGTGYKVYTPRAFETSFEKASSPASLFPNDNEIIAEVALQGTEPAVAEKVKVS